MVLACACAEVNEDDRTPQAFRGVSEAVLQMVELATHWTLPEDGGSGHTCDIAPKYGVTGIVLEISNDTAKGVSDSSIQKVPRRLTGSVPVVSG